MMGFFKKSKKEPKDLKGLLSQFKVLNNDLERVSQELEDLKKNHFFSVQKIGIVRYNPFSQVGGDQSFSLAVLDGNNDGVVITSYYIREGNRVYGKPISGGKSDYSLSEEEKQAIIKAQNGKERKGKLNNETANSGGSGSH
ncbi:MAG: DUF4446 family protein [bacterium]|nr:DUF4446 family protein [bacterium]